MSVVIVERVWDRRHTGEELLAIYRNTSWCFQAHGVRSRVHVLATDGFRGCCMLDAPDAEAVRTARRNLGVPEPERLWPATVHGPVRTAHDLSRRTADIRPGAVLVLVERSFDDPFSLDEVRWIEQRGLEFLDRSGVELLIRFLARDQRRMVCLFEAPDEDSVRRASTEVGLPFDRTWTATVHFDD
ncbi:MAG TPA: nickel-binding protein [Azospirillum sp.]|nr:nickel-binding protein [Azospirillum sp.]